MLLASLGLHGLLLLLPTGTDEVPVPPPDPEQDSVAITRVPPAGESDVGAIAGAASSSTPLQRSPVAPAAAVAGAHAPTVQSARPQPPRTSRPTSQPRPQAASPASAQPTQPPAAVNPPTAGAVTPAPPPPSAPSATQPLFDADLGPQLLAYVVALNLPQAKIDRAAESIQNRFVFNASAVTRDTFDANQSQWVSTLRQEPGLAELSPEVDRSEFSTVYPQRVCLSDSPGEINVGAVVNPDGSWRGEPALLRGSGYGVLDRKALEEIQRHRFAEAEGIRAYVLTIDTSVDYGDRPCLDPNPTS